MEVFIDVLLKVLVCLASTAVLALCGYGYGKLKAVRQEHIDLVEHLKEAGNIKEKVDELVAMQGPQNAALREILGKYLDEEHARFVAQGYASPKEKLAFERIYTVYHALGGNGTRTALYEDVLQMKSYPTD